MTSESFQGTSQSESPIRDVLHILGLSIKTMLKQIQFFQIISIEKYMFSSGLNHGNAGYEQFITTNVISKGLIAMFMKCCFRILVKKYHYIDIIKDLKQCMCTKACIFPSN